MSRPETVRVLTFILILTAGSCRKASERPHLGDFGAVTKADLLGSHSCESVGAKNRKKFQWTFADERFEITAQDGSLPSEVCQALLGEGAMVKRIEGAWSVAEGDLILTELSADGKIGTQEACLHPFITPLLRINFGNVQYILTPTKRPDNSGAPPSHPK